MEAILLGTYYQVLNFLRVRKALFFSFIFPIFLYVVFIFVWGNNSITYAKFICTGIIAIIVASNAIMALGQIIVQYNRNGMTKVLKTIPRGYITHMASLVLSRILLISCAAAFLLTTSFVISHVKFSFTDLLLIEIGICIGVYVFTLVGQIIAEYLEDKHLESSISNGLFYVIIFLSDCFYPITDMNPAFAIIVSINPMTPILHIMRGEGNCLYVLIIEIVILQLLVYKISRNKTQKR